MACGGPHALFEDGVCGGVRVRSHAIPDQACILGKNSISSKMDLGQSHFPVTVVRITSLTVMCPDFQQNIVE